jgi:hypothetical protein
MLWYKGWLETQFKLLLSVCMLAAFLIFFAVTKPPPHARPVVGLILFTKSQLVILFTWLAGAGIVTQPSFQATKGLHGSTLLTLSLPVSRFRLLAVRAGFGFLEVSALVAGMCAGLWRVVPGLKGAVAGGEMIEYALTLIVSASTFYFVSVLLATFLDDVWRMWGGMIVYGAVWGLSTWIALPRSVDIFRAIGDGSPLVAHAMPWSPMAFSLALSAILFFAALKIAQAREY